MNFQPGDTYIYQASLSPVGQRILIRSDDERWAIIPANDEESIFDHDMETVIEIRGQFAILGHTIYPATLMRNGINVLPEAELGYLDNIQF